MAELPGSSAKDAFQVLMMSRSRSMPAGSSGNRSRNKSKQPPARLEKSQSDNLPLASTVAAKRTHQEAFAGSEVGTCIGSPSCSSTCTHSGSHIASEHAVPFPQKTSREPNAARSAAYSSSYTPPADVAHIPEAADRTVHGSALSKLVRYSRPPAVAQRFDYFLVYDLEATCNRSRTLQPIEIIEVACVVVAAKSMSITASFQAYVRPTEHPQLDPFCITLTGIQQHQVDAAKSLAEVLEEQHAWLAAQGLLQPGVEIVPVTWTSWDMKIAIETECGWRQTKKPSYMNRWIDLKQAYSRKYKRSGNLRSCVEAAGVVWEGRAHSGIDDARNTAQLVLKLMRDGVVLRVTDSFAESRLGSNLSGSVKQATLAPMWSHNPYAKDGKWNGNCKCGIKASLRVTKKPGANHARQFHACGNWSITKKQDCGFFLWADDALLQGLAG